MNDCMKSTFGHSELVFNFLKKWIYTILATIIAIPISAISGILIGFLQACLVWIVMPLFRIKINFVKTYFAPYVRLFAKATFGPFGKAVGSVFSGVKINMK